MKVKNYYTEMLPSESLEGRAYIDALALRITALVKDAEERGYSLGVGLHHIPVELVREREGAGRIHSSQLGYSFIAAHVGGLELYSERLSEEKDS